MKFKRVGKFIGSFYIAGVALGSFNGFAQQITPSDTLSSVNLSQSQETDRTPNVVPQNAARNSEGFQRVAPQNQGKDSEGFQRVAPRVGQQHAMRLKSNLLPWFLTIPNLGAEVALGSKWSLAIDVWFCPWKLSDKFSVKTVTIFPEGRWWLKTNQKGSFFNLHLNVAWYNVRANSYRYQDTSRPLLGAGVGYGYRLEINDRWGVEFEIGAGMANTKYDRYYNVENGALKDTRVSTYWGIDRAAVAFTYYLCDL